MIRFNRYVPSLPVKIKKRRKIKETAQMALQPRAGLGFRESRDDRFGFGFRERDRLDDSFCRGVE
jgi:hypothetical protein